MPLQQLVIERSPCLQARKPYTITKQREKWTDQEHARFLDALRLYGRAWRRIEGAISRGPASERPVPQDCGPQSCAWDAEASRCLAEHIGSKTAVQVRSHAQKFFSKLEKQEAAGVKQEGVLRQLDADIISSRVQLS